MTLSVSKEIRMFLYILAFCTMVYGVLFYQHSKLQGSRLARLTESTSSHLSISNLLEASGMSHLRNALSDIGYPSVATKPFTKRLRSLRKRYKHFVFGKKRKTADSHYMEGERNVSDKQINLSDNRSSNASQLTELDVSDVMAVSRAYSSTNNSVANQTVDLAASKDDFAARIEYQTNPEREYRLLLESWKRDVLHDTELYASQQQVVGLLKRVNETLEPTDDSDRSSSINVDIVLESSDQPRGTNMSRMAEQPGTYSFNESETLAAEYLGDGVRNTTYLFGILTLFRSDNISEDVNMSPVEFTNSSTFLGFRNASINNPEQLEISISSESAFTNMEANIIQATNDSHENMTNFDVIATNISDYGDEGKSDLTPKHTSVLQSQAAFNFNISNYPGGNKITELVFPSGLPLHHLPSHIQQLINQNIQPDSEVEPNSYRPSIDDQPDQDPEDKERSLQLSHEDNSSDPFQNDTQSVVLAPGGYESQNESADHLDQIQNEANKSLEMTKNDSVQEHVVKLKEHILRSYDSIAEQLAPRSVLSETDLGYPKVDGLRGLPDLPLPDHIPLHEQIGFMADKDRDGLSFTTLNHVEDHFRALDQRAAPLLENVADERPAQNGDDESNREMNQSPDRPANPTVGQASTQISEVPAPNKWDSENRRLTTGHATQDPSKLDVDNGSPKEVIKFKSSMGLVPLDTLKEEVRLNQVNKPQVVASKPTMKASRQPVKLLAKSKAPQRTNVIFYSYLRGGSSIGSEIFNLDPQTFLWYEPLDAFYSAYFGIPPKTLPGNVLYWNNVTKRELMFDERRWLVSFFRDMFECKLYQLPPDVFTHRHNEKVKKLSGFVDCYEHVEDKITMETCRAYTTPVCGRTVEQAIAEQCHIVLEAARRISKELPTKSKGAFRLNDRERKRYVDLLRRTIDEMRVTLRGRIRDLLADFVAHQICVKAMSQQVSRCLASTMDTCQKSTLHVAKVLRLRFDEIEELTFLYPDLKVVYFHRDPRGIAYSRAENRLVKNGRDLHYIEEARYICLRMRNDLGKKKVLASRYPNKVLTISYEFMARHPHLYAEKIYNHLHHKAPEAWTTFIKRNSKAKADNGPFGLIRRDPLRTALRWKRKVNALGKQTMTHRCRPVLEELHYEL